MRIQDIKNIFKLHGIELTLEEIKEKIRQINRKSIRESIEKRFSWAEYKGGFKTDHLGKHFVNVMRQNGKAYVIMLDGKPLVFQWHKPFVEGFEPIKPEELRDIARNHIDFLIEKHVDAEVFRRLMDRVLNEDLRGNPEKAVKRWWRHLIFKKRGVQGVGVGYKTVRGRRTSELSIVCFVDRKLTKQEHTELMKKGYITIDVPEEPPRKLRIQDLVPTNINGIKTDVVESGKLKTLKALQDRTGKWRPAPGGVSIGHYQITAGTLGLVCGDGLKGGLAILSNNHVLANGDGYGYPRANQGDPILQPGPFDGGWDPQDRIGLLDRWVKIYPWGFHKSDVNECYDPTSDSWSTKTSVPTGRDIPYGGAVGTKIYFIDGVDHGPSFSNRNDCYDTETDSWALKRPPAYYDMEYPAYAVDPPYIYVAGGWGSLTSSGEKRFQIYNADTDTWVDKGTALPEGVYEGAGSFCLGSFHIMGSYRAFDLHLRYDPNEDKWYYDIPLPTPRSGATASVVDGVIYLFGGYCTEILSVVEAYDPVNGVWTTKANMPTPRYYMKSTVVDGKIYVIGGFNGENLGVNECYDPTTNTWSAKAPMPTPRLRFLIASVNGKIYCIGGYSAEKTNVVDAAVAKPLSSEDVTPNYVLDIGYVTEVRTELELDMLVKKSGRTSGVTSGRIRALSAYGMVSGYEGFDKALFEDQLYTDPIVQGGDSGSLVVDENNRAVGLAFAGSSTISLVNKIGYVIDLLKIQIPYERFSGQKAVRVSLPVSYIFFRGKVVETGTGAPIKGAKVVIVNSESRIERETDEYGNFSCQILPETLYSISISHPLYYTYTGTLQVKKPAFLENVHIETYNFKLNRRPTNLEVMVLQAYPLIPCITAYLCLASTKSLLKRERR